MKQPNFFIVGAPRSGTTALYEYLGSHPDIFLCNPKEPHYFATDLVDLRLIKKHDEYLKLFEGAGDNHTAVGEASVCYLFSRDALKNINKFNNKAKIIVMLRNPIEIAYSTHSFAYFKFFEKEKDFEKAWHLHEAEENDEKPTMMRYREICKLGQQVERLLSIFPVEQIKFILFDDFKKNTYSVYNEILTFLGVNPIEKNFFPQINKNPAHRNRLIGRIINNPPYLLIRIIKLIKLVLSVNKLGIQNRIRSINTKRSEREPLSDEFRRELIDFYEDDIKKLSKLLDINFENWLS